MKMKRKNVLRVFKEIGREDSPDAMIDNLLDIFPLSRFGASMFNKRKIFEYASKKFHSFPLFFVILSSKYYLKAMKMKRKNVLRVFFLAETT